MRSLTPLLLATVLALPPRCDVADAAPTRATAPADSSHRTSPRGEAPGASDPRADAQVVERLYLQLLRRPPVASEIARVKEQRLSESQVRRQVMQSDEYRRYMVVRAYRQLVRRDPSPEKLQRWAESALSESDLRAVIKASTEYRAQMITHVYQTVLHRTPTAAERDAALDDHLDETTLRHQVQRIRDEGSRPR